MPTEVVSMVTDAPEVAPAGPFTWVGGNSEIQDPRCTPLPASSQRSGVGNRNPHPAAKTTSLRHEADGQSRATSLLTGA